VFRFPSLRSLPDVLFLVACVILIGDILVPEIVGNGKTKDYPLWFDTAQQVLHGADIYVKGPDGTFRFVYPPFPAVLLALPSYFGKIPFYIVLGLLNVAAWWMTILLSNALAGSRQTPSLWVVTIPTLIVLPYVTEMFDIGQPNLLLLMLMLLGFWWLQNNRGWLAGSAFALAAAIKVFPVAVLPYLIWRKQWAAAASTAAFLGIFLVLVPAPVRGFERNLSELGLWYQGMVGSTSEKGFGQRDAQNWSYINQSLVAVTHRLVRPLNYFQIAPEKPPAYVNVLNLDYKTANWVVLGVFAALGLGFIALLPPASRTTPKSYAEEIGILICLITMVTPLARNYYFIWLYFPVTVLVYRGALDPRPAVRKATGWLIGAAVVLLALSLNFFPKVIQALGNDLAATALIIAGLAWHLRNPAEVQGENSSPARTS
jgi:hypothetical protein